jgi:MFS family permease
MGAKGLLQGAIVVFLVGSALCGLSQNMTELIVFRAIQGLGGGGLIVLTVAVVGDIIPPRDRGRYQGFFGAVFGLSTVVGPLLGGFFVDNLSWRWIFYVNLPIGLIALAVISVAFESRTDKTEHSIDFLGAALLAGGLSAIVLYTSLGGTTYPWSSPPMLALVAAGVVLLVAFVFAEQRAAEPILPLELFRNRVFRVSGAVAFIVGLALFGAVTFVPLYLQNVKGHSPTVSGLLLTPMMAGVLSRRSQRAADQPLRPLQAVPDRRHRDHGVGCSCSRGCTSDADLVAASTCSCSASARARAAGARARAQNAVDYEYLGVASSGSTLFRQIGGSIGVALFGAIFANRLAHELAATVPSGVQLPSMPSPAALRDLPPALHAVYATAITEALHPVFLAAAGIAAVGFVLAWFLPEVPLKATAQALIPATVSTPRETPTACASSNGRSLRSPPATSVGRCTNASPAVRSSTYRHRHSGCSRASANARRSPRRNSRNSWTATTGSSRASSRSWGSVASCTSRTTGRSRSRRQAEQTMNGSSRSDEPVSPSSSAAGNPSSTASSRSSSSGSRGISPARSRRTRGSRAARSERTRSTPSRSGFGGHPPRLAQRRSFCGQLPRLDQRTTRCGHAGRPRSWHGRRNHEQDRDRNRRLACRERGSEVWDRARLRARRLHGLRARRA